MIWKEQKQIIAFGASQSYRTNTYKGSKIQLHNKVVLNQRHLFWDRGSIRFEETRQDTANKQKALFDKLEETVVARGNICHHKSKKSAILHITMQ